MFAKLIVRSLMMLFIVVGIGSYMIYLKTGQSPWSLAMFKLPNMPKVELPFSDEVVNLGPLGEEASKGGVVLGEGKTRVYKWQDEFGQWHYGEKSPEDVQTVESMVVNREQNVIVGIRKPVEPLAEQSQVTQAKPSGDSPIESPYSPEKIQKLFEDAKGLQKVLDDRAAAQEKLLSGQY
jgi:hypothetical protein